MNTMAKVSNDGAFATENINETQTSKTRSSTETKARKKVSRVQLDLPPRSMERLAHLKDITEAASYAEVVRNAIRLYEAMVKEVAAGREFLIKDPSGNINPYKVFLEP